MLLIHFTHLYLLILQQPSNVYNKRTPVSVENSDQYLNALYPPQLPDACVSPLEMLRGVRFKKTTTHTHTDE